MFSLLLIGTIACKKDGNAVTPITPSVPKPPAVVEDILKIVEDTLQELSATGLKIHISELDVNFSNFTKDAKITLSEENSATQKKMYTKVMLAYRRVVPMSQQYGLTCWSVGDADSWLCPAIQTNDWTLPFDDNY